MNIVWDTFFPQETLANKAACQLGPVSQVVNLVTNRVCRILGKVENTERFLGLALYQGIPGTGGRTKRMGAGISPAESDPMLVACAYNRQRLYLFSRREPPDTDEVATGRCCTGSGPIFSMQPQCCWILKSDEGGTL